MGNILVIGNGFDLAHGLPTGYEHFINFVRKNLELYSENEPEDERMKEFINIAKNNGFIKYFLEYTNSVPGWVDLERLIRNVIKEIEYFVDDLDTYRDGEVFANILVPVNMSNILLWFEIRNRESNANIYVNGKYQWTVAFTLKSMYYTEAYGLNIRAIKMLLRKHLDKLIRLLQIYLQNYIPIECKEMLMPKKQIVDIEPTYVISFNYTDTYKIYGIEEKDVYHVHGSLANDNMVLGFDDDNPEELDFVYFKKYFQRIQKLTGNLDINRFSEKDGYLVWQDSATVHFYGHSMDKTDGDIIQELRSHSKGFVIYKYSQDDYEQKVVNLIDVFGKKDATEMIQSGYVRFVDCE